jgi:hypothetical protein
VGAAASGALTALPLLTGLGVTEFGLSVLIGSGLEEVGMGDKTIRLARDVGFAEPNGTGSKATAVTNYSAGTASGDDTVDLAEIALMQSQIAVLTGAVQAMITAFRANTMPGA